MTSNYQRHNKGLMNICISSLKSNKTNIISGISQVDVERKLTQPRFWLRTKLRYCFL